MVTLTGFRGQFPEFKDPEVYTSALFNLWSSLAYSLLNANRWADQLDYAASLVIAHHFVLGERERQAELRGGVPGEVHGLKTAKSVDKVSASMNPEMIGFDDAAFWNATSYGMRLFQLIRLFGAGGIQVGVSC